MQTVHGIRFLPVGRLGGMQIGLDARWFGVGGWGLLVLLALAAIVAPLLQNAGLPLWHYLSLAASIVAAVVLTSLGHELGHVVASRIAGLSVRALVLAPQGGVTIRAGSNSPAVNFMTALAGPLGNALLGGLCLWIVIAGQPVGVLNNFVVELAALQLLTAAANLLPVGRMDGQQMLAALRAGSASRVDTVLTPS